MLAAALAAGNALNMGTSHTGALGFSVGTLQKLSNLKVGSRARVGHVRAHVSAVYCACDI